METDSPTTDQATLPSHVAEETGKDEDTKDAEEVAKTSPAESGPAEIEAVEEIPAQATGAAENLGEKGLESRVEECEATTPTIQGPPATEEPDRDTNVTAEPEPPVHSLTPAEAETIDKPEDEESGMASQSGIADADAQTTGQFIGETATDGPAPAASDATAGIEDCNKDKSADEIGEALASNLAEDQAAPSEPTTISGDANDTANTGGEVEELTSEAADEPEVISHPDVTAPTTIGQDTEDVKESDGVGQEPTAVISTENSQNDEAKLCEVEKAVEPPPSFSEKISEPEAEVVQENSNGSPSDMSFVTEVADTPKVGQDTETVTESGTVGQETIPVSSTDVQNDETNLCECEEGVLDAPNRIEEKISEAEAVQENSDRRPIDEKSCVTEFEVTPEVDPDTEAVRESDRVDHEPIPDSSTDVQIDDGKARECQEGFLEAPNPTEEKISEAEAVQENNNYRSPSDEMSSVTELAVTPEVGSDTDAVRESASVSQESIPVSSTDVQNDEAKALECQEGFLEEPNQTEERISEAEAVQEKNDYRSPSDEMSHVTELAVTPEVGSDTDAVRESHSAGQESIPVSSTDVQNDEPKARECQEGVLEAPNRIEEKILEADDIQEKNEDRSPNEDVSCIAEVAVTSEVVEQIKRRTLQGLLMAEKNTENLLTGDQNTDTIAATHPTTAQEFDSNNSVEKSPDLSKENIAEDNSDFAVPTNETPQVVEAKDYSTITEEAVKESVLENANTVAEETKEMKSVTEKHLSEEEGKQGEARKADSTEAVKPAQRHTNNIMSKVKQSIVKVKKVIGKSLSSKTLTTTVEAGEVNVK
ncbi:hypothetical protein ACP4OV_003413 [Aristida adscensionis]